MLIVYVDNNVDNRMVLQGLSRNNKTLQLLILQGLLVEVAGFEPAAFWSRTKRATKLRYTSKLEPMRGLEPLTC